MTKPGQKTKLAHTLKLVEFYCAHSLSVPKHDLALKRRENQCVFKQTYTIRK